MFKDKNNKKILFFGPSGSYTDLAKDKFIEKYELSNCEEISKHTIISLLRELDETNDKNMLAVIPIENSIEGFVRETLDNLSRLNDSNIKILSEIIIPISHCLITKAEELSQIHTVVSYPQGLAQCRDFLTDNLNENINIRTSDSTAQAVKDISLSQDYGMAAIASEKAAKLYNMPVLMREINDVKDNKTRFVLIGRDETQRTGNDKTSITFTTENKPGALNKVLNILESYNINMSYINSRPSKKFLGEYTFYIDFDGHVKDLKIAKALFEIIQHTKSFKHVGSYSKHVEEIGFELF